MFRLMLILSFFAACNADVPADDQVLEDFELESWGTWISEGTAFGNGPAQGTLDRQMAVSGFLGKGLVNSYHDGDSSTGTLTSTNFVITHQHISFLMGGGSVGEDVGMELLVGEQRVRFATGRESEELTWHSWDVRDLQGQTARLRIIDRATGSWGHILVDQILLTSQPRESLKSERLESYRRTERYYRERFRPQYHFTPEMNWMNDPNGLVYYDGEYHLFYQHNPHGNEWGHMSWGHAVSTDLLHWQHLPIALHDEYGVMAFSGSAVVDEKNTSGFGKDGRPALVAIYTGHGYDRQTQDLAYSNDRGRTWTKYSGNPVLDLSEKDFRDPKVFWHEPTQRWVMVVSLAVQKRLQFYASPDLKSWSLLSEFGPAGVANKPNWECPDLFALPIENEPNGMRWLLEADMGSGAIAGGSGGEYFTGHFDGTTFHADSNESEWVDFGRDFYAPVSWSNIPASDGRRLWLGWMNNWETCLNPTFPWRSAMSIPREMTLRRIDGRLRLCQKPIRELQQLRSESVTWNDQVLSDESRRLDIRGQQLEIIAVFEPGDAVEFGFRVLKGASEQTVAGYDVASRSLFVDRTESGDVDFHPAFSGRHSGPLGLNEEGLIRMHILVDACSVEVFGNSGETVITDLVFPDAGSQSVEVYASAGTCRLRSCTVFRLVGCVAP